MEALPRLRPVVDYWSRAMNTRKAESADVALVLEGTFPYVSGGLQLINQIIRAYPDIRFAIVFLGPPRGLQGIQIPAPGQRGALRRALPVRNLNATTSPPSATATARRSI